MANITASSIKSNIIDVNALDVVFLIFSFIIAVTATILNCAEIRLILRKWKKATDFEVILFHLAIADLMNSIGNLSMSSFLAYNVQFSVKTFVNNVYYWVSFGLLGFFYSVSMKLVLVIGIERLVAIKLPLKHRLWHTSRKVLYRQIIAAWLVSAVVVDSCTLADYFIQNAKGQSIIGQSIKGQSNRGQSIKGQRNRGQSSTGQNGTVQGGIGIIPSRDLSYILATYMTVGVSVVLICYIWLLHVIVMRATNLLKADKKDYKLNPKIIKLALKKESATIIICRIVLLTFLACNVPMIVALYRGKIDGWTINASNLNAVINPLIYFFKGYIEDRLSRKKLVLTSVESGGPEGGGDVASTYPVTSDAGIELGVLNMGVNVDIHASTNEALESSKDKGESSLRKLSETFNRHDDDSAKKSSRSDTFLEPDSTKPIQN